MLSVNVTPRQAELVRGLVACGYYANASEVGRAAIEGLVAGLSSPARRRLALHLHGENALDILGVAEVARIPVAEAQDFVRSVGPPLPRMGPAAFRRELRSHAVQERLLHMAAYRSMSPAEGLRRGARLVGAAGRARRQGRRA